MTTLFPTGPEIPSYPDSELAGLPTGELWQRLIQDEDRVPRNLIDECARRGDEILDLATDVLESEQFWTDESTTGRAWLPIHAVMIIGLMPDERAGVLTTGYMRRMAFDDDLQDWLGGYWAAFFRNKPDPNLELLKTLAADEALGWFMRSEAFDAAIAMAQSRGDAVLDPTLEWAARFAFDEKEDETLRDLIAGTLLDFARPEYRAQLEAIADQAIDAAFSRDDIERIYAAGGEPPWWTDRPDPWEFYSPKEVEARQARWAEEDMRDDDEPFDFSAIETYVRDTPKVGRNDPCPCGSGKKYKKCCLEADSSRS